MFLIVLTLLAFAGATLPLTSLALPGAVQRFVPKQYRSHFDRLDTRQRLGVAFCVSLFAYPLVALLNRVVWWLFVPLAFVKLVAVGLLTSRRTRSVASRLLDHVPGVSLVGRLYVDGLKRLENVRVTAAETTENEIGDAAATATDVEPLRAIPVFLSRRVNETMGQRQDEQEENAAAAASAAASAAAA